MGVWMSAGDAVCVRSLFSTVLLANSASAVTLLLAHTDRRGGDEQCPACLRLAFLLLGRVSTEQVQTVDPELCVA